MVSNNITFPVDYGNAVIDGHSLRIMVTLLSIAKIGDLRRSVVTRSPTSVARRLKWTCVINNHNNALGISTRFWHTVHLYPWTVVRQHHGQIFLGGRGEATKTTWKSYLHTCQNHQWETVWGDWVTWYEAFSNLTPSYL